jgi:predicted kinase
VDSVSSEPDTDAHRRKARAVALAEAVARVESHLPPATAPGTRPALVVFSGVPGSGKSYLARLVQPHLMATIVETDMVRRVLFPQPRYTGPESAWVYAVCHDVIAHLLSRSQSVIFDATNLQERGRQALYHIAERVSVRLVIVRTIAPDEVIRERLVARSGQPDNHSDAGISVYEQLRATEQPIRHPHLLVDTTQDCVQAVWRIVCECRM